MARLQARGGTAAMASEDAATASSPALATRRVSSRSTKGVNTLLDELYVCDRGYQAQPKTSRRRKGTQAAKAVRTSAPATDNATGPGRSEGSVTASASTEALTDDLMWHILQLAKLGRAARLVCKRWCRLHDGDATAPLSIKWGGHGPTGTTCFGAADLERLVAKLPRHSALKVVGEPEWLNANLATALCGSLPAAAAAGPSTSVAVSPSPSCKGLLRHTLRDLEIAGCCIVDVDCAPLAAATALTRLVLEQLWELRDVGFLQGCGAGLRSLTLNDCPALASLAGLSSCPGLESLYLSALEARPSLSPLSRLTQLGELSLMGRSSDDLAPLAHCTALHTVRAWQLSAAPEQLAPLGRLPGLRHLEFRDSTALIDVTPLSSLTCLSHLDLSLGRDWRGSGPTDLRPLSSCTALVYLSVDLSYNGSLESVAPLAALTRLERLRLAGCSALRWVAPLVACTALRHLCLFSVARQPVPDDIWELDACRALEVVAVDKLGRIDLRGRTVSKALVDTVRSRYRQMVEWIASKWGCWPQLVARADRVHHNTAPTVAAAGGGSSGTHDPDCFFHSWGPG